MEPEKKQNFFLKIRLFFFQKRNINIKKVFLGSFFFVFVMSIFFTFSLFFPSKQFPIGKIITIESGSNIKKVAIDFKKNKIIKKSELLVLATLIKDKGGFVVAGDYLFEKPLSVFSIAERISTGGFGDTKIKITIPEGSSNKEIADIVKKIIPDFDSDLFLEKSANLEGYLFPDTYFVFPSIDPDVLIKNMNDNFKKKTEKLEQQSVNYSKNWQDIVIMASLLEKEAFPGNNDEHKIVSGILWKRISIQMPLQVDAPFLYLLDKSSSQLTLKDLASDSPYNTYTNKGLPIGPIGNPGLVALEASLFPVESPYLFYLHDKNGKIHYATNHEGHVRNKKLYLK